MLNTRDSILQRLRLLNLGQDEARIYLELLKEPSTHLKLARVTGINRTKVYRLVDQLEKRSLINVRSDDRGTFLIAADPATLEVELVTQEEKLKTQRRAFDTLLPVLTNIKTNEPSSFIIHTYEGTEGFKQMLWHELKTKGENVMFGAGALAEFIDSRRWIEQQTARMIEAGYSIREIINPGEVNKAFSIKTEVKKRYHYRMIPAEVLHLENQIAIYNDTVSIYHWRQEQKVGIEIVNQDFANTMKQMFEMYWQIAAETP